MADDDGSGTVTIPEVTVEGDAEAGRAYNDGYALGTTHDGTYDPVSHGMQHADDYNQGVLDGDTDAAVQANDASYDGPSIGPTDPAEIQREQEEQDRQRERQDLRRSLGEDPYKPEQESENPFKNEEPAEWPEMPEIVAD